MFCLLVIICVCFVLWSDICQVWLFRGLHEMCDVCVFRVCLVGIDWVRSVCCRLCVVCLRRAVVGHVLVACVPCCVCYVLRMFAAWFI